MHLNVTKRLMFCNEREYIIETVQMYQNIIRAPNILNGEHKKKVNPAGSQPASFQVFELTPVNKLEMIGSHVRQQGRQLHASSQLVEINSLTLLAYLKGHSFKK